MQFNSYSYLMLLAVCAALYWRLPFRFRRGYVLLLSALFYAAWKPSYVWIPFLLCGVVYWCGARMAIAGPRAGRYLRCGIGFTVALLAFFKYRGFLVQNLNALLSPLQVPPVPAGLWIVLPLGISFYSFEAVSYLLDKRQGRIKGESLADLALFVSFWPHMIAGPIVRFRELVPQFRSEKTWDWPMLTHGLDRLIWGLVQKNLLANSLAAWVQEGFAGHSYAANSTLDNWIVAAAFGLQIYFDFAAYSNMAIGAAALFGIALPENFRTPYHAATPAEFWSRWHMTLSRWIRDYLFFPINARHPQAGARLYLSLIGIMAVVGLWHGAGWGFVLWGTMHGIYLVGYRMWERWTEIRPAGWKESGVARLGWRVLTLAGVLAAWIPFRASSLHQCLTMLREMFFGFHFTRLSLSANFCLGTGAIAAFCALEPFLLAAIERLEKALQKHQTAWLAHALVLRPLVYALGLLLFIIFDDRDVQFIYFQF